MPKFANQKASRFTTGTYAALKDQEISLGEMQKPCSSANANGSTGSAFSLEGLISNVNDRMFELSVKIESIVQRVDNIEKCLLSSKQTTATNSDESEPNEMHRLGKLLELLSNKFTLVETDIVLLKQVRAFSIYLNYLYP
jgi:hypothetical protein